MRVNWLGLGIANESNDLLNGDWGFVEHEAQAHTHTITTSCHT